MAARNQARAPTPSIPNFREDPTSEKKDISKWIRTYDVYLECVQETMGNVNLTDGYKKATLQLLLGTTGLKDFATNPEYANRAQHTYAVFRQHVIDHFKRRLSKTKARVDFQKRCQEPGETIHDFLQALRKLAEDCQFADTNNAIQTQLLAGTSDQWAQTELMAKVDLPDLDTIIKALQASETATDDLRKLRAAPAQRLVAAANTQWGRGRGGFRGGPPRTGARFQGQQRGPAANTCPGCGGEQHQRNLYCPAWGKTCSGCGRVNHFVRVCKDRETNRGRGTGRGTGRGAGRGTMRRNNAVQLEPSDSEEANRCEETNQSQPPTLIYESFHVQTAATPGGGKPGFVPVRMLVDSGANTSILSEKRWTERLGRIPLQNKKTVLRGANGEKLQGCLGTVTTKVAYGGRIQQGKFYIFQRPGTDTLGTNFLRPLRAKVNLDKMTVKTAAAMAKEEIAKDFPKLVGTDMGNYTGTAHRIKIQEGTTPVAVKLRPIPVRLQEAVNAEIRKMDELGIWELCRKSEWVHPLVAVPKKDGGVRITSDLTRLNKVVIPDWFPIPRIKDILREMGKCTTFSKLDLRKGYFHVPLHPESRPLTTTATPLGLRQYCRLPMGLKDSASAFQQRLQEVLQDIPGARVYIDDIVIGGYTQAEHDERLRQVLCKLQKAGFRLQLPKVILSKPEIPAFGYILSAQGIRPDPANVASVKNAPPPTTTKELLRFLGMVTYFQDFLPDLTAIAEPLRQLTHQEATEFEWGAQQQLAFETVKAMLENAATLKPFDPQLRTVVTVDASDVGIGAIFTQQHKSGEYPVAYWNKTLDSAQHNYSVSEKEALAGILACEHWEDLLLGTPFILRTDHKALTSMFTHPKTRRQSSKFDRWKERLGECDFEVQYHPGDSNNAADYLSRLEKKAEQVGVKMNKAAGIQLDWLRDEALRDLEYQKLVTEIKTGVVPAAYKCAQGNLTVQSDLATYDMRIIPPPSTRTEILRVAHQGHPGMTKTKQLLRRTYYWPRMSAQIENMVNNCDRCQASTKTRKSPPQPVTTIPRPTTPGAQWGLDITGPFPNGQNIVVAIDYASRFLEVLITKTTTTTTIKDWLQALWDRQGLPTALVTDNGPQFISKEMEDFLSSNDVHHYTIAVYNPRENGLVERFNGYLKAGMETFEPGNWKKQVQQLVAAYRRMPVDGERTALDIFYGRKVRVPAEPNVTQPTRRTAKQQEALKTESTIKPYEGWSLFREGEEVATKKPQVPKGQSPWSEPRKVKRVLGAYTFLLDDDQVWSAQKIEEDEFLTAEQLTSEGR